jgi:hypothetical protein
MNPRTVGRLRSAKSESAPATTAIVVTSPAELAALIRDAVANALEAMPGPSTPHLLDRRGLAEALGCCPDTVDKLRKEGLPTVWVVDSPRFELDRVLEWLRERPAT